MTTRYTTATAIAKQIDRLLQHGWLLATCPMPDNWPDTWAVTRDWEPIDPTKVPIDPVRRFTFGTVVVRDFVGFLSDGTVIACRWHLAGDTTQWSRSGPAADTIDSIIALPAPENCCQDTTYPQWLWGTRTPQVLALFRARGWHLSRIFDDDGNARFDYTHGVGTAELDRPRLRRGQGICGPLGIMPLSCRVTPALDVRITGWRVHTGCAAHRATCQTIDFHAPGFHDALGDFESAATTADLTALAYCLVYGDCSKHELDLTQPDIDPRETAPATVNADRTG